MYFRTSAESSLFFAKLRQSEFDLAIVNPFDSVPAIEDFGYKTEGKGATFFFTLESRKGVVNG